MSRQGKGWRADAGSIYHTLTMLQFSHVNQVFPILTAQFTAGGVSPFFSHGNTEQCALDLSVCINDPFVCLLDFHHELLKNESKNPARKVSLTACGNL